MPKRFIIVPERFKPSLDAAIKWALLQGASITVQELYQYVKRHLAHNNVPHRDHQMETHEIPEGHAYWSHE